MGWETRKGKGLYYTRSRRVGGRVMHEYVGSGPFAVAMAEIDALNRERREQERAMLRIEQEAQQTIDRRIDEMEEFVAKEYRP